MTAFLSYARTDRPRVASLYKALKATGLEVWWDGHIPGGAAFAREIETALDGADIVIVVWTAASVRSDWVRDEAAKGRDRKRLVPVSLDGTEPPLGFGQYHAIDFSRWDGTAASSEVTALIQAVNALATPEREVIAPPPRFWTRRRMVMAGGATAGAVALGALGIILTRAGGAGIDRHSIAVLPFANLSGDPEQAYFSDGLSEEVRSALARDARLKVMGQASAGQFSGHELDARTVAQKLGVAYILGGSVRRSSDVVRIAAELTDGGTGYSRWSQSFDRQMKDVFAVQSEIASVVLDNIADTVGQGTSSASTGGSSAGDSGVSGAGTRNPEAYDAYLRGQALYLKGDGEASARASLAQFNAAIDADPNFAAAHSGRARALALLANSFAKATEQRGLYDAAIAAAERGVALAPDRADSQYTLAKVRLEGRLDVAGARPCFLRAYQLGHNEAPVLSSFAYFSSRTGAAGDARAAIARAIDIDPLNPFAHRTCGVIRIQARQFSAAVEPLRRSLELNPKLAVSHAAYGWIFLAGQHNGDARDAFREEPAETLQLSGLAIAEGRLGNTQAANEAMQRLVAQWGDGALYQQAQVLAQWGQFNAALTALEKARATGDAGVLDMAADFLLDPIRSEPRFLSLLSGLGLA